LAIEEVFVMEEMKPLETWCGLNPEAFFDRLGSFLRDQFCSLVTCSVRLYLARWQ